VHLGVAIAIRGGGLVAPAIHDADQLSVEELMAQLKDLTQRVRAGRFRASELRDPSATVTSMGDRGVESVQGVIYPPQVACIGIGKIVDRPWSMPDRSVASRQTISFTLAADHRVSDGRSGARLLATIDKLLRHPDAL
jgi:pyruvate dehydrogenase E2 component (dihydrolipoamide acetyltransferase)